MQLVQATCKFPGGAPRTSQSGREYVSALFVGPDGQEHRVYAPPMGATTEALQQLHQGQTVMLALDSRGRAHLALPDNQQQPMGFTAPPQPTVQPQAQLVYQHHQAAPAAPAAADPALALADQWAAAFARLVSQGVPPEVAGPGASTILIQLGRR